MFAGFLMLLSSEFVFLWNPSQPIRELSVSFERFAVLGNKDVMAKQCGAPQRYFSDQEERQSYRKPNEAHIPGTAADHRNLFKQGLAQACAACSPKSGSVSAIEIFR
jgi:hypothetical protein